jgi:hypothetical protein
LAFESAAGYRSRKSLGWLATGTGLKSYHAWLLVAGGCHVITEEAAKGTAAMASRMKDPDGMYKGHDIWLKQLKALSENKQLDPSSHNHRWLAARSWAERYLLPNFV